jgi:hypothetical protein
LVPFTPPFAVKLGVLPVPLAAKPIDGFELVQIAPEPKLIEGTIGGKPQMFIGGIMGGGGVGKTEI